MQKGFIYKVTNNVTGESYIGQTRRSVEFRWRQHVKSSDCYDFHKAIRKYGKENFTVETLEECPVEDLDSREIYWINKYNTFKEGYNMTKGGYAYNPARRYKNGYIMVDSKYDEIEGMYLSGFSATRIAEAYQVDRHVICNILKQMGHKITYDKISLNTIETKELIEKYSTGWSLKQLAKLYGYSPVSMKDFLIKKGVDIRKKYSILENEEDQKIMIKSYLDKDMTVKDLMKKYHCQYSTFCKVLSLHGVEKTGIGKVYKMTDAECLKAIRMFMDNLSVKDIADKFKVDKCTIYHMFRRYHIDYLNYNTSKSAQTL